MPKIDLSIKLVEILTVYLMLVCGCDSMTGKSDLMKTDGYRSSMFPLVIVTLVTVLWAYWATIAEVVERWWSDPQYSHGFLVPIFSCYLLWMRRIHLTAVKIRPSWWGVGIVLVAAAMRMVSHFLYQPWLDNVSLLFCLAGITATVGGRSALAWAGPAILFLSFILPLPYRVQTLLGGTLQRIAIVISTYALQTLGVPAVSEGNVILLTDSKLGIVEACNGLSMLVTFFALSTAVAIVASESLPEKFVIVVSAVPIAILANVARITATGVLVEAAQGDLARAVFHDLAGWLMMPLALGMLLLELYILRRSIEPARKAV